ncbi:hypothetical protein DFH08DRAFT_953042 [Mycena albidolilacea]|uniref:Major facilitator superfamily (MFS) profile domain-containing protein n=1 Tax=Mycena albidolilacea TaxID=1033008 RepID=A0AAD7AJ68_9AGAR|nr:hypothetical protein DFH08DRAFT_953042 [Mycena albidolilacea]
MPQHASGADMVCEQLSRHGSPGVLTVLFLKETANGLSVLFLPPIFKRGESDSPGPEHTAERGVRSTARADTEDERAVPLRRLMTRRVIVAASNYAFLALVDNTVRTIQPLFFATPIELGGLGLPTARIGNLLTVFGLLNGVFQVFFFARIHDYLGSKTMFIVGLASALPTFGALPLMNHIARFHGVNVLVWAIALTHVILSIGLSFSYGAVFIYISAAAPNRASLGATNGLCQLTVSLFRAVGPALANSLFSLSMEKGYLHGQSFTPGKSLFDLNRYAYRDQLMMDSISVDPFRGGIDPAHRACVDTHLETAEIVEQGNEVGVVLAKTEPALVRRRA